MIVRTVLKLSDHGGIDVAVSASVHFWRLVEKVSGTDPRGDSEERGSATGSNDPPSLVQGRLNDG